MGDKQIWKKEQKRNRLNYLSYASLGFVDQCRMPLESSLNITENYPYELFYSNLEFSHSLQILNFYNLEKYSRIGSFESFKIGKVRYQIKYDSEGSEKFGFVRK